MEEQNGSANNTATIPNQSKGFGWLYVVISLIVIIVVAGAVYFWQHHQVTTLQAQVDSKTQSNAAINGSTNGTFVYKTSIGNMVLTLPKSYAILNLTYSNSNTPKNVQITSFSVVSVTNSNVLSQDNSNSIQVSISSNFNTSNLNQVVSSTEKSLTSSSSTNVQASSAKVAGLSAQVVTASNKAVGYMSIYLVSSGGYLYTISVNSTQANKLPTIAQTVFNDMKIS